MQNTSKLKQYLKENEYDKAIILLSDSDHEYADKLIRRIEAKRNAIARQTRKSQMDCARLLALIAFGVFISFVMLIGAIVWIETSPSSLAQKEFIYNCTAYNFVYTCNGDAHQLWQDHRHEIVECWTNTEIFSKCVHDKKIWSYVIYE